MMFEKWNALPWDKKILNIASELTRTRNWRREGQGEFAGQSLDRALELIDLSAECASREKSFFLLRELLRFREALSEFYLAKPSFNHEEFNILLGNLLDLEPNVHNLGIKI